MLPMVLLMHGNKQKLTQIQNSFVVYSDPGSKSNGPERHTRTGRQTDRQTTLHLYQQAASLRCMHSMRPNNNNNSNSNTAGVFIKAAGQTDRQTDRPRYICINRPHIFAACMRCGLTTTTTRRGIYKGSQTGRQRDRPRYICINRPHIFDACIRCGLTTTTTATTTRRGYL